jgi:D-alanyl-lipoteichoic acid acyltransferase DltB (MBOAT superfamily)
LTYILYWPLYMAGPIMSYNDFYNCIDNEQDLTQSSTETLSRRGIIVYTARWLFCIALIEILLSNYPVFAIQRSGLLYTLSPSQLAATLYLTLQLMWLKFLLIWRFFTLAARIDGIDPPENMLRCVSNNYSLSQFWRGWHASFNKWIIKYMYVPMQGRTYSALSVWPAFIFVALWHDFELKLLAWGLLNAVFYILELAGCRAEKSSLFQSLPSIVKHLLVLCSGAMYILVLMGVNLIGYAFGIIGFTHMYKLLLYTHDGRVTLLVCFLILCAGVRVMKGLEQYKTKK